MTLELLPQKFSVCQIENPGQADLTAPFTFLSRTDEEISLVCESEKAPKDALKREDGWRGLRIAGLLDFSLIGILAKIAGLLAAQKISTSGCSRSSRSTPSGAAMMSMMRMCFTPTSFRKFTAATALPPVASMGSSTMTSRSSISGGILK